VFLKVRITSLSLNERGIGRGCIFDNLNISPSPKIPSHKGRGLQL